MGKHSSFICVWNAGRITGSISVTFSLQSANDDAIMRKFKIEVPSNLRLGPQTALPKKNLSCVKVISARVTFQIRNCCSKTKNSYYASTY